MSVSATEQATQTGLLGTTPTGPAAGASTTTSTSADKDMFLQLLVAQMKYQDPMNPTDSSQFLSQSAQFTSLEKMQDVADQTAQLVNAQTAFGASSLVGRNVSWLDADGTTKSGAVSGVTFGTDGPVLDVGSDQVSLGQVQSVNNGTGGTGGTGSTSTNTGDDAGSTSTTT